MQHGQGMRWGVLPVAWPKRLHNGPQVLDVQRPVDKAKKLKAWCQSANASTDHTQGKAVGFQQPTKVGWRNKWKPILPDYLSVQQTRPLSTKASAMLISTKLVDGAFGFGSKKVQLTMASTIKWKTYQQIPSKTQKVYLSTGSNQQNTAQSTDNLTETQHDAASSKNISRTSTPQPPDPETCCESGCANCVWIRYVQEMQEHAPCDKEQMKKVLDLIEDHNVKMFVKMELGL